MEHGIGAGPEVIKQVLGHPGVRPEDARAHSLGRLVRQFDRHLQQADGVVVGGLGGDPEAELLVHPLGVLFQQHLEELFEEREPQVAVLGQYPVPSLEPVLDQRVRRRLLPLAHTDGTDLLLALFRKAFNLAGRVRTLREQEQRWHEAMRLIHDRLQVQLLGIRKLGPEGFLDVV